MIKQQLDKKKVYYILKKAKNYCPGNFLRTLTKYFDNVIIILCKKNHNIFLKIIFHV